VEAQRKQPHPRIGYAALGLALAVAVVGGRVFPHGAQWAVAAILLWAGWTIVARARGGRRRRPAHRASAPIRPRVSPLKPGETYQDAVKLTLVPNVPLAELWCQRLRENGIEAFYKAGSPFGGDAVGIADLNPGLPAEIWVGENDTERARQLFPELR
jgi:hypothetical protein